MPLVSSSYRTSRSDEMVPKICGQVGVLAYDPVQDKVQCHICGRWYRGLNNHLRRHGYTTARYREEFGLAQKQGLICEGTKEKIRQANKELGLSRHLLSQRLTKEDLAKFFARVRLRRGSYKLREQTCLAKSERLRTYNPMDNPVSQTLALAKLRHTWYGTDRQIEQSKTSLRKCIARIRARNIANRRYLCCGIVFPTRDEMRTHCIDHHQRASPPPTLLRRRASRQPLQPYPGNKILPP